MFIGLRLFEIAIFLYLSLFWINHTTTTLTTTPTTPPLQQTPTTPPLQQPPTTPPQQPPRSTSAHGCQRPGLRRGKAGGPRPPSPERMASPRWISPCKGKRRIPRQCKRHRFGGKTLPSGSFPHVLEGRAGVEKGRGLVEKRRNASARGGAW